MNDRELLELAAKAAGFPHPAYMKRGSGTAGINQGPTAPLWNPLTDDGDALRLAVKLELELDLLTGERRATTAYYETASAGAWKVHEPHANDPLAATRRAIVRAAAAVGEKL